MNKKIYVFKYKSLSTVGEANSNENVWSETQSVHQGCVLAIWFTMCAWFSPVNETSNLGHHQNIVV